MNSQTSLFRYISLFLVLSFFYIHNIKLVLLGIIFSIYELNKDLILNLKINHEDNKLKEEEVVEEEIKDNIYQAISKDSHIENKNDQLTLVETIEEYGFIPSIANDDDNTDIA